MASLGKAGVQGPLFEDPDTDVLDIVEHLLELDDTQAIKRLWGRHGMDGNTDKFITGLVLLDIARSLRKISDAQTS